MLLNAFCGCFLFGDGIHAQASDRFVGELCLGFAFLLLQHGLSTTSQPPSNHTTDVAHHFTESSTFFFIDGLELFQCRTDFVQLDEFTMILHQERDIGVDNLVVSALA